MSDLKRSAAVECTLRTMAALGPMYFWTLTTPDEVHDPKEISARWHNFLTVLARHYKGTDKVRGMRIYEHHPNGHGIHIHFVVNKFLSVNEVRHIAEVTGFGRVHVCVWERDNEDTPGGSLNRYLQKYLFKGRSEDWSGTRIYATFGLRGLATRQCDIEVESPYRTIWQAAAEAIHGFKDKFSFSVKVDCVRALFRRWVCDEVADPRAWAALNLVPISTTAMEPFNPESAWAWLEIRMWDREEKLAERRAYWAQKKQTFAEYHEKAAAALVARSAEWA